MIADGAPFARADLKVSLAGYPDIRILWETGSLWEAAAILKEQAVDLLFLDVRLRGGPGLALLPLIRPAETALVLVTCLPEADRGTALDVLLKPVTDEALDRTVSRVRQWTAANAG